MPPRASNSLTRVNTNYRKRLYNVGSTRPRSYSLILSALISTARHRMIEFRLLSSEYGHDICVGRRTDEVRRCHGQFGSKLLIQNAQYTTSGLILASTD